MPLILTFSIAIFVTSHLPQTKLEQCSALHLSALGKGYILDWLVGHVGPDVLNLPHDLHAIDNLSEDNMLVVEMRQWDRGDEKLASVRVWTRVLQCLC